MRLDDIAGRMQSAIRDNHFVLCAENTLCGEVGDLLSEAFGLEELDIKVLVFKKPESGDRRIVLEGDALIEDCRAYIRAEFAERSEIAFSLNTRMDEGWMMPLTEQFDVFSLRSVSRQFGFTEGKGDLSGAIEGKIDINGMEFAAFGKYDREYINWAMEFRLAKGALSVLAMLSFLFETLKIPFPADKLPDVDITDFIFRFSSCSEKMENTMYLEIKTDAGLLLTDTLGITHLGFSIEMWSDIPALSLYGDLVIGKKSLPAFIRFNDEQVILGITTDKDGVVLPSFADLCSIVHLEVSDVFPAIFTDILLSRFVIFLPSSIDSVESFTVSAVTQNRWELFAGLSVEKIWAEFSYQNGAVAPSVAGLIALGGIDICIFAGKCGENWIVEASQPEMSEINISDFISSITQQLLGQSVSLPIPDITICGTSLSANLTEKSLKVSTMVTASAGSGGFLDRFFAAGAKLSLGAKQTQDKTSFDVAIDGEVNFASQIFNISYAYSHDTGTNTLKAKWQAAGQDQVSVVSLLRDLGVGDIPSVLGEFDLGIRSISIEYDFAENVCAINAQSDNFGEVSARIHTAGQTEYSVTFALREKLSFSSLPVVGTSLKLLNNVAMENTKFIISNRNAELSGKVCGKEFVLPIGSGGADAAGVSHGSVHWFNINKSYGIFSFRRIGAEFSDGRVSFYIDASLQSTPVAMSLMGLGISFSTKNISDISFALEGLGVSYSSGEITMSGEFLRTSSGTVDEYAGKVLIRVGDTSLLAVGLYSGDSLFVYALLGTPLGGPPVFFVTGLAAGFGYNQRFIAPEIGEVSAFPLVAGALGNIKESDMVARIKQVILPTKNSYFLSAGVRFTSFKIVESFALVTIEFGDRFEVGLIGLSTLNVPFNSNENPIAHAQLAIKARVSPEEGLFSVVAQLTSESYILSKSCKLVGGFALFTWFGGVHKGDFVLTLGGYHPLYEKPGHYPSVPRVGFKWIVDSKITIAGDVYFALTPSCLMAGGRFEAVYKSGALKAWFIAKADFIIQWKPLFYDASVYISLGASYRVDFLFIHKTYTIELTASLHIWGPEFAGTAYINWFIISFSVSFGNPCARPQDISWSDFKASFLPDSGATADALNSGVCAQTVSFSGGLVSQTEYNGKKISVVRPDDLEIIAKSSIPGTEISLGATVVCSDPGRIGILPMGEDKTLSSLFAISVTKNGANVAFEHDVIKENLPSALWGTKRSSSQGTIQGVATGLAISPVQVEFPVFPKNSSISLTALAIYAMIKRSYDWSKPLALPENPYSQEGALLKFGATAMSSGVIKKRRALLDSFAAQGFVFGFEPDVTALAGDAQNLFDEEMYMGVMQ